MFGFWRARRHKQLQQQEDQLQGAVDTNVRVQKQARTVIANGRDITYKQLQVAQEAIELAKRPPRK